MEKLYILDNAEGFLKIGITNDLNKRLKNINKNIEENVNQFKLICDFNVNYNPAILERYIHEFLGVKELNLLYLKDKYNLIELKNFLSKKK